MGGLGSSNDFAGVPWLDFDIWQSGHGRNTPNFLHIEADYARENPRPVLDGEPGYEDHKAGFALKNDGSSRGFSLGCKTSGAFSPALTSIPKTTPALFTSPASRPCSNAIYETAWSRNN